MTEKKEKGVTPPKGLVLTLSLCFFLLIILTNFLWPKSKITKAKIGVARWPFSIEKHLQLAQVYFENNQEDKAFEELEKGKDITNTIYFPFQPKTKHQIKETEDLLNQRQDLKEELQKWEQIIETKPYYRDVLLKLAVLSFELKEDQKAKTYWQKANYLDPNNVKVLEIGKLIGEVK